MVVQKFNFDFSQIGLYNIYINKRGTFMEKENEIMPSQEQKEPTWEDVLRALDEMTARLNKLELEVKKLAWRHLYE